MKSLKGLQYELRCSLDDLENLIGFIDNYYYKFDKRKIKADGSVKIREIEPSKRRLKVIQKRINDRILTKVKFPNNVQGGVKGKSNITNAKLHLGKKFHFCTDIKKCFPSIRHNKVYSALIDNGFSPKVARLITNLCTYKGKLPQGNPTSSSLANIVLLSLDKKLIEFCNSHKIVYSRFVDDLVFSSQTCFKDQQNIILSEIYGSGFRISHRKTFYKIGPAEITGILVKHNKLALTNELKQKLLMPRSKESLKGLQQYVSRIETSN